MERAMWRGSFDGKAVTFSQVIQPVRSGSSGREPLELVFLFPLSSCLCCLLVKPTGSQRTKKPIDVLQTGLSPQDSKQRRVEH